MKKTKSVKLIFGTIATFAIVSTPLIVVYAINENSFKEYDNNAKKNELNNIKNIIGVNYEDVFSLINFEPQRRDGSYYLSDVNEKNFSIKHFGIDANYELIINDNDIIKGNVATNDKSVRLMKFTLKNKNTNVEVNNVDLQKLFNLENPIIFQWKRPIENDYSQDFIFDSIKLN
ncbi:MAG: hypothetical protein ACRCRZ_03115 [Metamycoplasmataceae bacterium]